MKCKYENDGDCCNCGSPQYLCKCKPKICHSVAPVTNADRIRAMSDEELAEYLSAVYFYGMLDGMEKPPKVEHYKYTIDWMCEPAEGEQHETD